MELEQALAERVGGARNLHVLGAIPDFDHRGGDFREEKSSDHLRLSLRIDRLGIARARERVASILLLVVRGRNERVGARV